MLINNFPAGRQISYCYSGCGHTEVFGGRDKLVRCDPVLRYGGPYCARPEKAKVNKWDGYCQSCSGRKLAEKRADLEARKAYLFAKRPHYREKFEALQKGFE